MASLFERAKKCIPHQTMTMSKRADQRPQNAPYYCKRGRGNLLVGEDDKLYIDYMGGLGANILGYRRIQTDKGYSTASYSLPVKEEVELAEKLVEIIPSAEMVRILKTGSEACNSAVRIARAYTGRTDIAVCGYHGHLDVFNYRHPGIGTPQNTKENIWEFKYGEIPDESYRDYACVIMEPIMLEEPNEGYLQAIRDWCTKTGTVLIFDEIITGFWWGIDGIQGMYNVIPDLTCLGKAMGNGAPISAVVGKREFMDNDYFVSSTYAGETMSIDFALSTIQLLEKAPYKERNEMAETLFKEINKVTELNGFPWRAAFPHKEETFIFWQEMVKQGFLFGKPYFFNFAVTDDMLKKTINAVKRIDMSVKLEGWPIEVVFDDGRQNKVEDLNV